MKIGVVVTVYNIESYIETCLTSILGQTYKDLEIIVVDDGSTDQSGAICDRIAEKDRRIAVIHQDNQGPILARLAGVEKADADVISFVDGDDWLDINLYSEISNRGLLGAVDVVSFGAISYHSEDDWKKNGDMFCEGVYSKDQIVSELIPWIFWDHEKGTYGIGPSLWGKIFKKKMLKQALTNVSQKHFHYGEDVAVLYPLLCKADSIAVIKNCYYYYRQRKNNEVAGYFADNEYFKKLFELYDYLKQEFEKTSFKETLIKQLDYFYMYSVGFGKLKYSDLAFEEMFMFPFKKVERNKKLVLYGAGRVGQTFYQQLKRSCYCEIAGWVDKNHSIYPNRGIQSMEKLKDLRYDYIVIAIESQVTSQNVKESLKSMGIDEKKMITL